MVALFLYYILFKTVSGKVYRLASDEIKQECDFQGQLIRGVTVLSMPYMSIDPFKVEELVLNDTSQSYDITPLAHGMIVDILKVLATACNFTYEIHLGKDINEYGTVIERSNGTLETIGLFDYVVKPSPFDMIFADMAYTSSRFKYIDYLPPFSGDRYALVIGNDLSHAIDPWMFVNPLTLRVWICLLIMSLSVSGFLLTGDWLCHPDSVSWTFLGYRAVQGFSSNFGGGFLSNDGLSKTCWKQVAIFAYFFLGVMIWIYYQSFIISGLANHKIQYPFTDLEGLSQSDYFLTSSSSKMSTTTIRFTVPTPGTVEEKIFENNMDWNRSFIGGTKGLALVHKNKGRAHFALLRYMQNVQQKLNIPLCELTYVWKSQTEEKASMITRQNFKHFAGLKRQMMRLKESGQLSRLAKAYDSKLSSKACMAEVEAITLQKLGSLFVMLAFSMTTSVLVLSMEYMIKLQ